MHWSSGISHWPQRYLAWPVPVDIVIIVVLVETGGNMPLVTPLHKWMGVEVRVRVLCWHEGDLTFETLFQTRASILVDWLYGRDRSFFSLTYFQRGLGAFLLRLSLPLCG